MIITLTTDFGLRDPFVGVMKGRIFERAPAASVVDLSHDILAHWPAEAGFWLAHCHQYFPAGTLHVAVVDPGVGTARAIAMVELADQVFLAPDNGLLAPVLVGHPRARCWHLEPSQFSRLGIGRASATFHGRDIFAPLAAELATGRVTVAEVGRSVDELVPGWVDEAIVTAEQATGVVITIDHFGNLISNIEGAAIERWVEPHVYVGALVLPLRRTYGEVKPGTALALINSFGVVEIAVAEGRASDVLGLSRGAPIVVRDSVRKR
jgi:hypothetical protein